MIEKNNRITIYKDRIINKIRKWIIKIFKKEKNNNTSVVRETKEIKENNSFHYLKFNVDDFNKLKEKEKFLDEICEDQEKFNHLSINQLNIIVDYYENKLKKLKNS